MKKTYKVFIIIAVVVGLLAIGIYYGYNFVTNYVFDKMYNHVITEMIDKEKEETPPPEKTDAPNVDISNELPVQSSGDVGDVPSNTPNKVTPDKNNEQTKTEVKLIKISELTPEQLAEIQALITSEDKAAAINMVKAALTKDDKREIKAMLEKGKIDYTRVKQILSKRLNAAEKKQIYGYYEKYSRIYFESKKSKN